MPITLYHSSPSPIGRAAVLAVRNLPIEVTIKELDLAKGEQLKCAELNKINPQHTIPTLDDNGFVLCESRAIMSYLATKYGPDDSLYPKDTNKKAIVDQRLYFDACTFWPRLCEINIGAFSQNPKVDEVRKAKVFEALGWLDTFLDGHDWLCGDNLTIADLCSYATVSSAAAIGFNISKFEKLNAWLERCRKLPGADENEAGAKYLGDFIKSILEPGQLQ